MSNKTVGAALWLTRFLKRDSDHSPEIIKAVAETEGIARRTLYRAAQAIGVRRRPDGTWHAPDASLHLQELLDDLLA